MSAIPWEQLLKMTLTGHAESLGLVLEQYRNRLLKQIEVRLGSRLSARIDHDDILQDISLKAHRDFSNFRGDDEAALLSWLQEILVNTVTDAIRHHEKTEKRSIHNEERDHHSEANGQSAANGVQLDAPTPGSSAMKAEEYTRLHHAMALLEPDEREVLRLRYVEGATLSSLADRFGCSLTSAANRLKNAVHSLRSLLGSQDNSQH